MFDYVQMSSSAEVVRDCRLQKVLYLLRALLLCRPAEPTGYTSNVRIDGESRHVKIKRHDAGGCFGADARQGKQVLPDIRRRPALHGCKGVSPEILRDLLQYVLYAHSLCVGKSC